MTYNTASRKPLTPAQRPIFLARNGAVCIYCRKPILPDQKWQDCHIIARELGGSDDWDNRGPGHIDCHKEDTRQVAKLVAHGNRLIRKNGPPELRRKTKPIPAHAGGIPSRPFQRKPREI